MDKYVYKYIVLRQARKAPVYKTIELDKDSGNVLQYG
jgi:hypothetical protein